MAKSFAVGLAYTFLSRQCCDPEIGSIIPQKSDDDIDVMFFPVRSNHSLAFDDVFILRNAWGCRVIGAAVVVDFRFQLRWIDVRVHVLFLPTSYSFINIG